MGGQREKISREWEKIAELLLQINDILVLEMICKCIENVIKEQNKQN